MVLTLAVVLVALAQTQAPTVKFEIGQKLQCDSAHSDRHLEAIVGRIDTSPSGETVVSIELDDRAPGASPELVAHMPFAAPALASSCPKVIGAGFALNPEFEQGYAMWREAFITGKGGYYTITVDQALDIVKATLAQGQAGHHV